LIEHGRDLSQPDLFDRTWARFIAA
jgi:hypothetical protein